VHFDRIKRKCDKLRESGDATIIASDDLKASFSVKSSINPICPLPSALQSFAEFRSASRYGTEIIGIIRIIQLFENLGCGDILQLCRKMEYFSAKRGELVVMEGGDRDFRGIVPTSEVGVINCEVKPVAFSGAGVFEDEISLIDGKTRIATCIAPNRPISPPLPETPSTTS
jgi:hypothetical protein